MSTEMTHEEVVAFQDGMVDRAKVILEKVGHLVPMFFVLTKRGNIDDWVKATVLDANTLEAPVDDGESPEQDLILMIPAPYDHAPTLLKFIEYLSDSPESMQKQLDALRSYGNTFFNLPTGPEHGIIEAFKKLFKTDGKGIVANFISKVCQRTGARAYVQVCEAWTLAMPMKPGEKMTMKEAKKRRRQLPDDFADSPDSQEVVISMLETRKIRRQVVLPFTRTERKTGKVSEWGTPLVKEDDGSNSEYKIEGRFFNLLQGNLH